MANFCFHSSPSSSSSAAGKDAVDAVFSFVVVVVVVVAEDLPGVDVVVGTEEAALGPGVADLAPASPPPTEVRREAGDLAKD